MTSGSVLDSTVSQAKKWHTGALRIIGLIIELNLNETLTLDEFHPIR